MRTARLLKYWVTAITLAAIAAAWMLLETSLARLGAIALIVTAGLVLRIIANLGQLAYDLKSEVVSLRVALAEWEHEASAAGTERLLLDEVSLARLDTLVARLRELESELERLGSPLAPSSALSSAPAKPS